MLRTQTHPELAGWTVAHPESTLGATAVDPLCEKRIGRAGLGVALQYDAAERLQFVYKPGSETATVAPSHYWKRFD